MAKKKRVAREPEVQGTLPEMEQKGIAQIDTAIKNMMKAEVAWEKADEACLEAQAKLQAAMEDHCDELAVKNSALVYESAKLAQVVTMKTTEKAAETKVDVKLKPLKLKAAKA